MRLSADPSFDSSCERFSSTMDDGRDLMKAGMRRIEEGERAKATTQVY
jgi:hypothetical protein